MTEPAVPASLPEDEALAAALEEFCARQEAGEDPDPQQYSRRHPDFAACLEALAAMESLHGELQQTPASARAPVLADYEILREVGRGGMGVVYEARHRRLDRRVALKMIKSGDLADADEIQRFQAEAKHVASLPHPNIVQIYEVGEAEGRPFLALEFVDGTSLDHVLAQAPLPALAAARLLETVARAMHHAHLRGIVHRDLKPANILLDESAAVEPPSAMELRPKITDFGLAKRLDTPSGQTHTGTVLGTPPYMAPEQAAGQLEAIGPLTDVYALGAILYEALTGRPPFKAASPLETLLQVRLHEPVPPRRLQPHLPIDLETICLKCLHKEAGKRYASAAELADDLGRFGRGEPIRARPLSRPGRLVRWCRRNPLVAVLTSVAATLALAAAALLLLHLADLRTAEARAAGRRDEILRGNVREAEGLASTVLLHLQHLARAVAATAQQQELRELLAQSETPAGRARLQGYFERVRRDDPKRGIVGLDGASAFHTWHALDRHGTLIADVPEPVDGSVIGQSFRGRDYFQGALRNAGERRADVVHASRIYKSKNDRLYKFTLSAPVLAGPEPGAAVVGVICATLPARSTLGALRLHDKHRTAALINRDDTNPPHEDPRPDAPERYRILVHPAYRMGEKAVEVERRELRMVRALRPDSELQFVAQPERESPPEEAMNAAYQDPVAQEDAAYAGPWLAGFAQVGNTELLVLVQQRAETVAADSVASSTWGVWLLVLALAAILGAAWLRRARPRRPAPAPPALAVTQEYRPGNRLP